MFRDPLYITYPLYTNVTYKYNLDNMKYCKGLWDYELVESF